MVKPDTALRRLWHTTGTLLEPYGFDGADPAWTRAEPAGLAAVHRTRVVRSWTDGEQIIRFGLYAAATPAAWQDFRTWRTGRPGPPPPDIALPPLDPPTPWSLRLDPGRPGHALPADLDAIRDELPRRVHACARRALQLAEPGRYAAELLALPERRPGVLEAVVVLLAGEGPGPLLADAVERLGGQPVLAHTAEVTAYARARAAPV